MISVRFDSDIERHAGNAALAAATAAPTSSTEAKSTWRVNCPVAGSYTGPSRPDDPATRCPPIQWLTRPGGAAEAVEGEGSATWVMVILAVSRAAIVATQGRARPFDPPATILRRPSRPDHGGPSGRSPALRIAAVSRGQARPARATSHSPRPSYVPGC